MLFQGDGMKNKSAVNDVTIDEMRHFRRLEDAFLSRCRHFGYQEIKTSTIGPLHLFTALGTMNETKRRRIYSFIDWDGWSGERVALKPDSTACVARFFGDHYYPSKPRQKFCYVENHFEWADSWDEISERWQFGIENIGNASTESDVEVIYLAWDILQKVGFQRFFLHLSYPSIIDRLFKMLPASEREKAESRNVPEMHSAGYLENLRTGFSDADYAKIREPFDNFIKICKGLDALDCQYTIDFSPLGELEYYTGVQFQILSGPKRKSGGDVLCAGGRYDQYIPSVLESKNQIPAVGFALYARNITRNSRMESSGDQAMDRLMNIAVYIGNITKKNVQTGQMLCDKLSTLGFFTQIDFTAVEAENYDHFGLIIEVDHERFDDGYQILHSRKIGKPLLKNLFGES